MRWGGAQMQKKLKRHWADEFKPTTAAQLLRDPSANFTTPLSVVPAAVEATVGGRLIVNSEGFLTRAS